MFGGWNVFCAMLVATGARANLCQWRYGWIVLRCPQRAEAVWSCMHLTLQFLKHSVWTVVCHASMNKKWWYRLISMRREMTEWRIETAYAQNGVDRQHVHRMIANGILGVCIHSEIQNTSQTWQIFQHVMNKSYYSTHSFWFCFVPAALKHQRSLFKKAGELDDFSDYIHWVQPVSQLWGCIWEWETHLMIS